MKAGQYAYRDRRAKKRTFRSLWIVRIGAAAKANGYGNGPSGDSRGVEIFFDGVKFDANNPQAYLNGLRAKAPPQPNDPKRLQALAAADPDATLKLWDGVNHVLKTAPADRAGNLATYADPDLPLAPGVTQDVAAFIRTNAAR